MEYLIYCTKAKPHRIVLDCVDSKGNKLKKCVPCLNPKMAINGKVVAEFDGEIEPIVLVREKNNGALYSWHEYHDINISNENECDLLKKSCLTLEQIEDYLPFKPFKIKTYGTRVTINDGYAIHINDLKIFNEPKKLKDYSKRIGQDFQVLSKAPQNMMYCVDLNQTPIQDYILISIRPEWVCKILNGEKTIEVRKKVLKEML